MILEEIRKETHREFVTLSGVVRSEITGDTKELSYTYPANFGEWVSESADCFVPALMLPAMASGESLQIQTPVSPQLLTSLKIIQTIFAGWFPHLSKIEVRAPARGISALRQTEKPKRTAAFFSGGVDSFYTLQRNLKDYPEGPGRVSHIVFIEGFESSPEKNLRREWTNETLQDVKSELGVETIYCSVNSRNLFDLSWGPLYHGAVLASVALSLSAGFQKLIIPSSFHIAANAAWGSHPHIDHHWSTEDIQLHHDSSEVYRVDKIREIASWPLAQRRLKVCLKNQSGGANCGLCRKCIRTMMALTLLGVLDKFTTFPNALPSHYERKFPRKILGKGPEAITTELRFTRQILRLSTELGHPDPKIRKCAETLIRMGERKLLYQSVIRDIGAIVKSYF